MTAAEAVENGPSDFGAVEMIVGETVEGRDSDVQ